MPPGWPTWAHIRREGTPTEPNLMADRPVFMAYRADLEITSALSRSQAAVPGLPSIALLLAGSRLVELVVTAARSAWLISSAKPDSLRGQCAVACSTARTTTCG